MTDRQLDSARTCSCDPNECKATLRGAAVEECPRQHAAPHASDSDAACAEHGSPLTWERGGADMPTTQGRWYCAACQTLLTAVLIVNDASRVTRPARIGANDGE